MNQAEQIIQRFGGLSALAKALGGIPVSTVQGWKERGIIPAGRQADVLNAARSNGVALEPADFFPPVPASNTAAA